MVSPLASPALAAEARAVYSALDKLPTEVRIAFLLRRVEKMTVPEIAAEMRLSERTVKRRVAAAEVALASIMDMDDVGADEA